MHPASHPDRRLIGWRGAALLGCLLLVSCFNPWSERVADPLQFLPTQIDLLLSTRFPDLIHSPLGDRFLAEHPGAPAAYLPGAIRALEEETGIDLYRDIQTVAVAAELDPRGGGRFVAVIEGSFDRERMEAWFEAHGEGDRTSYRGVDLFPVLVPAGPEGVREFHAGFLRGPFLLFGEPEMVAAAIDLYDGVGTGIHGDPGWARRLENVDRDATVWVLLPGETIALAWRQLMEWFQPRIRLEEPLREIRTLAVELRIPMDAEFLFRGETVDAAAAASAAGNLSAVLSLARALVGEKHPGLALLLDTVRIVHGEEGILVGVDIPIDWFDPAGWEGDLPRHAMGGEAELRSMSSRPILPAMRMLFSSR